MTGDIIKDGEHVIGMCLTATAPSREIDGRLMALLHGRSLTTGAYLPTGKACLLARNPNPPHDQYVVWSEGDGDFNVPKFTASLDACLKALSSYSSDLLWEKRIDGTIILKRAGEHAYEIVGGFAKGKSVEMSFCIALATAKIAELNAASAESEAGPVQKALPDHPDRPDTAPYEHQLDEDDRKCLLAVDEYIRSVADESLIDDDGFGFPARGDHYATGDRSVSYLGTLGLVPSDGLKNLPRDCTHVVWYNT